MKKIFYLLFISSVVFASCTKQDPIDVVCNCGGSGISVDTSLVGYWVDVVNNVGMSIGTDFSGNFYSSNADFGGFYSCDGNSHLSFTETAGDDADVHWTGNYSISGNVMTLNLMGHTPASPNLDTLTLTKQ